MNPRAHWLNPGAHWLNPGAHWLNPGAHWLNPGARQTGLFKQAFPKLDSGAWYTGNCGRSQFCLIQSSKKCQHGQGNAVHNYGSYSIETSVLRTSPSKKAKLRQPLSRCFTQLLCVPARARPRPAAPPPASPPPRPVAPLTALQATSVAPNLAAVQLTNCLHLPYRQEIELTSESASRQQPTRHLVASPSVFGSCRPAGWWPKAATVTAVSRQRRQRPASWWPKVAPVSADRQT